MVEVMVGRFWKLYASMVIETPATTIQANANMPILED
jgi:hypothetical protein